MSKARQPTDPWGLSATEWEAMTALIVHGTTKPAARQIGVPANTFDTRIKLARAKIRGKQPQPLTRLQAALIVDRFIRGAA